MTYEEFVALVKVNGWTIAVLRSENAPPPASLLAIMDEIGLTQYERLVMQYQREGGKMRGERFKVRATQVRALTYGPTGQRCECWLPAGVWQCDGECNVMASRDDSTMVPALVVFRPGPPKRDGNDGAWYVGMESLADCEKVK